MFILCLILTFYFILQLYDLSIHTAKNTITLSQSKFEKQISSKILDFKTLYLSKRDLKDNYRYGLLFSNLERVEETLKELISLKFLNTSTYVYKNYLLVDNNFKTCLSHKKNGKLIKKIKSKGRSKNKFTFFYSKEFSSYLIIDPIYNNERSKIVSWIILLVNPKIIKELIESFKKELSILGYEKSEISLFTKNKDLLFSSNKNKFKFKYLLNSFKQENDFFINSTSLNIKENIFMGISIPFSEVMKGIYQAIYTSFLIVFLIFIVFFFLMYLLLKRIVINPILLLTKISEQMKNGNLKQEIQLHSIDEIGALAKSFENMARSIQSGIDNLEEKVEERTDQLKNQNLKLQSFMNILSHDLKNPIGAIKGLSEILIQKKPPSEEIQTILKTSQRVLNLVDDLLGKNTIENAKMRIEKKKCELLSLVQSAFLENQTLSMKKDIKFDIEWIECDENEVLYIYIDESRILQVLNNLISNAIKFSYEESSILIICEKINSEILIGIKDQGIGIGEILFQSLISQKEKTSTLGTNKEQGTGIGLPLVNALLLEHQSKLEYKRLAQGSFFFFRLDLF